MLLLLHLALQTTPALLPLPTAGVRTTPHNACADNACVCVCLRICRTMQSEADNRPMLAEDALSREVARDVVVHDHVQDGERMHASLQGVVMGSKLSLAIAYAGVLAFAVWILQHLFAEHAETHSFGWAVAGIFVLLAVPLSLHEIHMHAIHYVSPLQRFYIRIIWMVPIYSVESFLALRFKEQKVYLETLREAYESWFFPPPPPFPPSLPLTRHSTHALGV